MLKSGGARLYRSDSQIFVVNLSDSARQLGFRASANSTNRQARVRVMEAESTTH